MHLPDTKVVKVTELAADIRYSLRHYPPSIRAKLQTLTRRPTSLSKFQSPVFHRTDNKRLLAVYVIQRCKPLVVSLILASHRSRSDCLPMALALSRICPDYSTKITHTLTALRRTDVISPWSKLLCCPIVVPTTTYTNRSSRYSLLGRG